jgi:hypothetical protein
VLDAAGILRTPRVVLAIPDAAVPSPQRGDALQVAPAIAIRAAPRADAAVAGEADLPVLLPTPGGAAEEVEARLLLTVDLLVAGSGAGRLDI